MARHVVGVATDIPPGGRRVVTVRGREIVIFNVHGDFYALLNKCPHQGAELSAGFITGISTAEEPGPVKCARKGEFLRCPWHSWEFDIRTGQSWCSPDRISVRQYPVAVEAGADLVKGPYKVETIPISVDEEFIVVDV